MHTNTREPRFINVRKLAAIDLVFRGTGFILIEFAFTVALAGALGTFMLVRSLGAMPPSMLGIAAAVVAYGIGLNYVPLLLYAMDIVRRKSARAEVATELAQRNVYARKYGVQQFLLVVPLAMLILAAIQEASQRGRRHPQPGA